MTKMRSCSCSSSGSYNGRRSLLKEEVSIDKEEGSGNCKRCNCNDASENTNSKGAFSTC